MADMQGLMTSNYNPLPVAGDGDVESEKVQLQRVILDSAARRFQAHKIYLRIAAAKRWDMSRNAILRSGRHSSSQLRAVDGTLRHVRPLVSFLLVLPIDFMSVRMYQ